MKVKAVLCTECWDELTYNKAGVCDTCIDAWEADWDDEDDLLEFDDSQPVELDAGGVLRITGSKIG